MKHNTVYKVAVKDIAFRLGLIAIMTVIWIAHLYLMMF